MKRLVFTAAAILAVLGLLAGCGEDSSSSSSGPAALTPPGSVVFVEGTVRPEGSLKSDVDSIASTVAGIDNLGEFVAGKLEDSARDDGQPFDYATEVEPWLGDRAGVSFARLEDGDLSDPLIAVESTDPGATQVFVDKQAEGSDDPFRDASYEGVEFKVGGSEDDAIGVVGDLLVIAEDERAFKAAVDASEGESLADEARFADAIASVSEGSLADVYVDVAGLLEQGDVEIEDQVLKVLQEAGIDPREATAVASLVPGADQIEIDVRSDMSEAEVQGADAPELLGELPADSFAAFAFGGIGEQLEKVLDEIDAEGIPGQVPPNQLKSGLKEAGIDLDSFVGSLQDIGAFAVGSSEASLGGALVLTTEGSRATNTVANIGMLLRGAGVSGVTALSGNASGFSVRSPDLGSKPLVVAAQGQRIAIGYGLPVTLAGLAAGPGRTLSDNPAYDDAVFSLGDTPIVGFAGGPAALRLADSLIPASEEGFEEAKRYLRSVRFLAIGSGPETDPATARLIVGLK